MEDDVLRLEIAPGVTIRVAKRAVARNLDRELAIPEELPPDDAGAGEEA